MSLARKRLQVLLDHLDNDAALCTGPRPVTISGQHGVGPQAWLDVKLNPEKKLYETK